MRTTTNVVLWALAALLVAWIVVAASGVLPQPTRAQVEALALLRAPPERAVGANNAFGWFWLLPYDIPAAEQDDVLKTDVAAFTRTAGGAPRISSAEGRYARSWPKEALAGLVCGRPAGCLDAVRADPAAVRTALAAMAPLRERLQGLAEFDHLATPFTPTYDLPLPEFSAVGTLQLTSAALRFVDGDAEGALTQLCTDLSLWRRLKGRSDSLVFEMVDLAWLDGGIRLPQDMRAALPTAHPLPPACATTFAPLQPGERHSCDVYRQEFAMVASALTSDDVWPDRSWIERQAAPLLFNRDATLALVATQYAAACRGDAAVDTRCRLSEQIFNPIGCALASLGGPDWPVYRQREEDTAAALALLPYIDWLARQADPAAAFASGEARPALPQRVDFADNAVVLSLAAPRSGEAATWLLPLPGSRTTTSDPGASP